VDAPNEVTENYGLRASPGHAQLRNDGGAVRSEVAGHGAALCGPLDLQQPDERRLGSPLTSYQWLVEAHSLALGNASAGVLDSFRTKEEAGRY
jgi:hypothetical protein